MAPESDDPTASARHDVGMAETKDHLSRPSMTKSAHARHGACIHISRYVEVVLPTMNVATDTAGHL